jgi:hypothetical protein
MTDFTIVPDCLVLKLEEIDVPSKTPDTTVYVLYDKNQHTYVVRGQRKWTPSHQSCTYSFNCEYASDLADFLQYVICSGNRVNETLFNYDNLPYNSDDITFEFLHNYDHSDYELSGYDNQKIKRNRLIRNLKMLRNIFNRF